MKNNISELVFILDRSGSMSGLESDTIGGFNSLIEKQKQVEGKCYVTTVLFDNRSETIHDRVDLGEIKPMTDKDYSVRGCTALLDALGDTIRHIAHIHKYARPEDVPEHTTFVIMTDGMENASHRYDSAAVKKMIEHEKEKYGWEFCSWLPTSTPWRPPGTTASARTGPWITGRTARGPRWPTRPWRRPSACSAGACPSPRTGTRRSKRTTPGENKTSAAGLPGRKPGGRRKR